MPRRSSVLATLATGAIVAVVTAMTLMLTGLVAPAQARSDARLAGWTTTPLTLTVGDAVSFPLSLTVLLQEQTDGGWSSLDVARTDRRGRVTLEYTAVTPGSSWLRVLVPRRGRSAGFASARRAVSVVEASASPTSSASATVTPSATTTAPTVTPSATTTAPSPTATTTAPTGTPSATTTAPSPTATTTAASDERAQVFDLTNTARAQARTCGDESAPAVGSLTRNAQLDAAAQAYAQRMADEDFFSHTSPDGDGPGDRATAAGYRWSMVGENIAAGQRTPSSVMQAWLTSSGHCANIMRSGYTEIGIGVARSSGSTYGIYWVQLFGRPR